MPHRVEGFVHGFELLVVNLVTTIFVIGDVQNWFQLLLMGTAIIYNVVRIYTWFQKSYNAKRRIKQRKKRIDEQRGKGN